MLHTPKGRADSISHNGKQSLDLSLEPLKTMLSVTDPQTSAQSEEGASRISQTEHQCELSGKSNQRLPDDKTLAHLCGLCYLHWVTNKQSKNSMTEQIDKLLQSNYSKMT